MKNPHWSEPVTALFLEARRRFPRLNSAYYQTDGGDDDIVCTWGSLMLAFGWYRRRFNLSPIPETVRFGPCPYTGTCISFLKEWMWREGVEMDTKQAAAIVERALRINDGVYDEQSESWIVEPNPGMARTWLQEYLEALVNRVHYGLGVNVLDEIDKANGQDGVAATAKRGSLCSASASTVGA